MISVTGKRKDTLVDPIALAASAWFKTGLFWVTQTIGILLPGEGGLGAEMKKTGRVSNRFRVQLKGVETL